MKNVIENPLVGSDPEVFVVNKITEQVVSVIDKLGGTKTEPVPMPRDGFFVQEDNVLAEFNIPPASSREEFIEFIQYGLDGVRSMLPMFHDIQIRSSMFMPAQELEDPRANIFGCSRDRNAWTGNLNPPPVVPMDGLRTGGGHISIGYPNVKADVNKKLVRALDFYLGVPSVIKDTDTNRRKLYGMAGAYRNKKWGVEYRTLSSFWLATPETIGWAYDQTQRAITHVNSSISDDSLDKLEKEIVSTINTSDVAKAKKLVEEYELVTP